MSKVLGIVVAIILTVIIGLFALLAISNWGICSRDYYVADQSGHRLTDENGSFSNGVNPCGTETCQTLTTTKRPALGCLLNPFPGGL